MKDQIIGIIGGNGVAATNKLLELIENKYTENGALRDYNKSAINSLEISANSIYNLTKKWEIKKHLIILR
jgi:aspartate/glutamate racemase